MTSRSVRTRDGRPSLLTDDDLWLFAEGTHARLYEVLGAHPVVVDGQGGTMFALWAPEAEAVSVVGDFNGWEPGRNPLHPVRSSGIWEGFVPGVGPGALYKYHLVSRHGPHLLKADPFAFYAEVPPARPRSSGKPLTRGRTPSGSGSGGSGTPWRPPSRSTRSTSGPGAGPRTEGPLSYRDLAPSSPPTPGRWGSPTSSSSR